jgi:hypothetical protein
MSINGNLSMKGCELQRTSPSMVLCKQLVLRSLGEMRLMNVVPSFSLITRNMYRISVRIKRTELVNALISLMARGPPHIV